jgi:hypothetical protein
VSLVSGVELAFFCDAEVVRPTGEPRVCHTRVRFVEGSDKLAPPITCPSCGQVFRFVLGPQRAFSEVGDQEAHPAKKK